MHEQKSKCEIPVSIREFPAIPNSTMKIFRSFLIAAAVGAFANHCAAQTELSIVNAGAVGNGTTLNTKAIQSAIDKVAADGGGTVVVPRGVFLTGAIFLKPKVNLHLDKDAVLKGSTDMKNYPLRRIRIEGHFEPHYASALINAEGCDGLKITGEGTLDGSGRPIWDRWWKLRRASRDPKNFPNLDILRAQLCIISHSKNVLVQGITLKNSQFWNLHLYDCQNVTVQNARFHVPDDYRQAPSSDGIDVDSCQDVTINGCYFSVTDDCIAMKGSKGPDALKDKDSPPIEHVRIENCTFKRGGGITLGSEATIVRDVVVENCRFIGPMSVLNFKLRPDTPQRYEDIHYRNITVQSDGGNLLHILPWTQYLNLKGQTPPKSLVENVTFENVKGKYGSFGVIEGNPGQTRITGITLANLDVQLEHPRLKAVNVKDLKLKDVIVNGKPYSLKVARRRPPSTSKH